MTLSLTKSLSAVFPLAILLSACAKPPAQDPYGVWVGKLVADEGDCPKNADAMLLLRYETVLFSPDQGAFTLQGRFRPQEKFYQASLTEKGMNDQPFQMVFQGKPNDSADEIDGIYASSRCRAHVKLSRPKHIWGLPPFEIHIPRPRFLPFVDKTPNPDEICCRKS